MLVSTLGLKGLRKFGRPTVEISRNDVLDEQKTNFSVKNHFLKLNYVVKKGFGRKVKVKSLDYAYQERKCSDSVQIEMPNTLCEF